MKRDTVRMTAIAALAAAGALCAGAAAAATFGELAAERGSPPGYGPSPYAPGPYAPTPYAAPGAPCPNCGEAAISRGPQGVFPAPLDAPASAQTPPGGWTPPQAYLPFSQTSGLPNGKLQVWSFGQVNSTTDPFNLQGLSTPFMFVPWSTPLSAWSNAQTWNWWHERSGVQPPYW